MRPSTDVFDVLEQVEELENVPDLEHAKSLLSSNGVHWDVVEQGALGESCFLLEDGDEEVAFYNPEDLSLTIY